MFETEVDDCPEIPIVTYQHGDKTQNDIIVLCLRSKPERTVSTVDWYSGTHSFKTGPKPDTFIR